MISILVNFQSISPNESLFYKFISENGDIWLNFTAESYQLIVYNVEMYWSLWGVSDLGAAKLVNCNQILGHAADQNNIEFID